MIQTKACKALGCKTALFTYSAETVDGSNLTCLNGVSPVVSEGAELVVLAMPEKTPSATTTKPVPSQPKVPTVFGENPNITGHIKRQDDEGPTSQVLFDTNKIDATGPFELIAGQNDGIANGTRWDTYIGFSFDASNSSSIYSGSKLQVNAVQVLACIKA